MSFLHRKWFFSSPFGDKSLKNKCIFNDILVFMIKSVPHLFFNNFTTQKTEQNLMFLKKKK